MPSASVIVLNCNGQAHLQACLPALEALDYPRVEIVVADNGSSDGSQHYVRAAHPRARLIEFGANLGFAQAYNLAIGQCQSDYVALLNNDTRVEPSWLTELVDAAERHGVAAAGALVLDWDGARVDFAGAAPTAFGHAWQHDHGRPSGGAYAEHRMLFACGAAALVRREHFLAAGGFDEDFFAYFEDVDLGWRLNLLGHGTVFAPRAVTHHRLHGTSGPVDPGPAPAALRAQRAEDARQELRRRGVRARAAGRGGPDARAAPVGGDRRGPRGGLRTAVARGTSPSTPAVVATLLALEDLARQLPALLAMRQRVQATRTVTDAELFALVPDPLALHDLGDTYRDTAEALVRDFRIAELFGLPAPPPRVTVPALPESRRVEVTAAGRVSVVVVTVSGATHLPTCLESLSHQAWPSDRLEVIVVDNGLAHEVGPVVERWMPGATTIRTGRNLGFSAGNNAGARAASGEYLLFLNDDTRVAPTAVGALVDVAERRRAAAVGAVMLDWSGERIDFAGGLVNFEGRASRCVTASPSPAPRSRRRRRSSPAAARRCCAARSSSRPAAGTSRRLPTTRTSSSAGACACSATTCGWRRARSCSTSTTARSGTGSAARARAFERNGLRMIYALLDDDHLRHMLPAALLLAADRAILGTAFSRAATAEDGAGSAPGSPRRWLRRRAMRSCAGARGARSASSAAPVAWASAGMAGAARETLGQSAAPRRARWGTSRAT